MQTFTQTFSIIIVLIYNFSYVLMHKLITWNKIVRMLASINAPVTLICFYVFVAITSAEHSYTTGSHIIIYPIIIINYDATSRKRWALNILATLTIYAHRYARVYVPRRAITRALSSSFLLIFHVDRHEYESSCRCLLVHTHRWRTEKVRANSVENHGDDSLNFLKRRQRHRRLNFPFSGIPKRRYDYWSLAQRKARGEKESRKRE